MNSSIRILFSDKGIKYAIIGAVFLFVIELIGIILIYPNLPPLIPLFNSLSWGSDRLTYGQFIFAIPAILVIITFVNIVFAAVSYRKHALLSRMVAVNLLLTVILSIIALAQIILLIF